MTPIDTAARTGQQDGDARLAGYIGSLTPADDLVVVGPPGQGKSETALKMIAEFAWKVSSSPVIFEGRRFKRGASLRAAEKLCNELSLLQDIEKATYAFSSPLLVDCSLRATSLLSSIGWTARETVRSVPMLDITADAARANDVRSWLLAPSANGLADDDRLASWALRAGAYVTASARSAERVVRGFVHVRRPSDHAAAAVRDLVRGLRAILRNLMAVLLAALSRGAVGYAYRRSLIAVYLRYGRRSDEPSIGIALPTRRHIRLAEMVPAQR